MHPMDQQTSIRLPRALGLALARQAKERGVPKAQLVREALELYLAAPSATDADRVRERSSPYLGALSLDPKRVTRDPTARLIRSRNWRP